MAGNIGFLTISNAKNNPEILNQNQEQKLE